MTTLRDEDVARLFHEAYERLAPSFAYETRRASAVPWDDVPEPNRSLMVAVAGEARAALAQPEPLDVLDAARVAAILFGRVDDETFDAVMAARLSETPR